MTYTIGTLLRNRYSGSMAIIAEEIPFQDMDVYLANQLWIGRNKYTTEQLQQAALRGMCIKEEEGDEWKDTCFILHRLSYTDTTIHQQTSMPYNHRRIYIDWEIVAEA